MHTRKEIIALLNKNELLDKENNNIVLKYIQCHDDTEVRNLFICKNLNLIRKIAFTYRAVQGVDIEDLIQEGSIGMIKAIEQFDISLGNSFSTYAYWWIKQHMNRYILNTTNTIRLPVHIIEKSRKIIQVQNKYFADHNCYPTAEYIAEETGLTKDRVEQMLETIYNQNILSLNEERSYGEDSDTHCLEEVIATDYDLEKEVIRDSMSIELLDAMKDVLTDKEFRVLELRFGLNNQHRHTLIECGEIFHVTRERIRQIENKALKKLERNQKIRKCA